METSNNAADQPKRTLLTGFNSFDSAAKDYIPKYHDALYCYKHIDKEHLSKGFLPRCPLLEKVFNDTDTSFDDIFYPPKFTKPPEPKSHREYKLTTIGQLIKVLNWWVQETVEPERPVFCFYAYSYAPCKRRTIIAIGGITLDNLITEFNYNRPAIAAELKDLITNLRRTAIEWDERARFVQKSQAWIDPSRLNPVKVKGAAGALLYKLRHIGSIIRGEPEQENKTGEKSKTKNRPTREAMKLREREVREATDKYHERYGHKPTAKEISDETSYTVKQVRATSTYTTDNKIKKQSGKTTRTFDTVGDSVAPSEFFSEDSELGSRTRRRSKSDEAIRDKLIDESLADDVKDEEQHKRYLRNKKKIKREES